MIKTIVIKNVALALVLSLASISLAAPAAACGGYGSADYDPLRVQAAAASFAAERFPRLGNPRVEQVVVEGDRARAVVRGDHRAYRLALRRTDAGWRVERWSRTTPA